MKALAIVGLWYCATAILVFGAVSTLQITSVLNVRKQAALATQGLAELAHEAEECKAAYLDLRELQRGKRTTYSGPEAIASSYAVQRAHEEYAAAQQQLAERENLIGSLQEEQSEQAIRLIPYVLAMLVHALAASAIWPYRRPPKSGPA